MISGGSPVKKQKCETKLQINIVYMLRLDFLEEDLIFYHVPNGGELTPAKLGKLKAMGMLNGMSDLVFMWQVGSGHNGWMESGLIEIKTDTGTLSDDQRTIRRRVQAMNGKYAVARCYETVRDTLIAWGVPCQHKVKFT